MSADGTEREDAGPVETAKGLAHDAASALNGVSDAVGLTPHVERHPYAALGVAFGVGYALAGGLFSPTTRRLLGLALKAAALPQVQNKLLDVAEATLDGMLEKARQNK